ncbi:MAG TPA: cytochrome c oxidase subunit 4, partial [Actinomycetota bacterium]|nr:cytochrome c oxidase subunit 4 [Actinomycetota bacterium]
MLEDLWTSILDLTAQFVIPDWGSIIALLPIVILVVGAIILIWTFRRLRRAPAARRGKQRLEPRTPAGIHMPGPSMSPIFAAIGAFLLFLGIVFGGWILALGAIALTLTLLYWLAEALRTYDHDIGDTVPDLPAVVHDGPPAGVHMPGPSFRPFLGALGTAVLMLGLVFGGWVLAAGVITLILTLVGWLIDAVKEYRKTVEADTTGHLENIPAPRTPKVLLWV